MAESRRDALKSLPENVPVKAAVGKSRKLAARIPRLILEARRVAATVIHGLHGRRRAGMGENFWQYRHFTSGEPAQNIDWRRSARDHHLYVREREWEASHTVWLWADRSPSMEFSSSLSEWSKLDRALVVSFAMAEVLVQGGERVGIPDLMRPTANRNVIENMAERLVHDTSERPSLPPNFAPAPFSEVLLLSDLYHSREGDHYTDNSTEALYAINCLDDPYAITADEVPAQVPRKPAGEPAKPADQTGRCR